ncbi:MAG: OmpH family outer membrane protein [Rhodospirillales bacterium]|nr:MAG: OmpH family outer membrane protein [Rhodospirillales bacterium]
MQMAGRLIGAIGVAVALLVALPASADREVPLRIAILDVQQVFQNAEALRFLQVKMREYVEAYRAETEQEERAIRAAQQELAHMRERLSPQQYEEERRLLERRLLQAQERVQQRKQGLDQTQQMGLSEVQGALNVIVTELAHEKSLTLILRKDQAVLNATALEITDEVLRRLNARLPTVDLDQPGTH